MGRVDELLDLFCQYVPEPDSPPISAAVLGNVGELLDLTSATPARPCMPPAEPGGIERVSRPPRWVQAEYGVPFGVAGVAGRPVGEGVVPSAPRQDVVQQVNVQSDTGGSYVCACRPCPAAERPYAAVGQNGVHVGPHTPAEGSGIRGRNLHHRWHGYRDIEAMSLALLDHTGQVSYPSRTRTPVTRRRKRG